VAAKKTSTSNGRRANSSDGLWTRLAAQLAWPGWLGLGVIVATAVAFTIYFLSSGGSSTSSINGNCDAQGSGNMVHCTGTGSKAGR
jgi:hypothetical protein